MEDLMAASSEERRGTVEVVDVMEDLSAASSEERRGTVEMVDVMEDLSAASSEERRGTVEVVDVMEDLSAASSEERRGTVKVVDGGLDGRQGHLQPCGGGLRRKHCRADLIRHLGLRVQSRNLRIHCQGSLNCSSSNQVIRAHEGREGVYTPRRWESRMGRMDILLVLRLFGWDLLCQ
eukprot:9495207-Pyramimonas_sp.AAC.1